jgi:hypothetical protein
LVFLMVAGLTACGVQGPPRPPRIEQPERILDLRAVQVGKSVRLRFTLPRLATDGERLTKPQAIEILRAMGSGDLTLWKTISSDETERAKQGDSIVLPLAINSDMHPPARVRLAVRTVTRGFRNRPHASELSSEAALTLLGVPDAIQNLEATVTEKAIQLKWTAPPESPTAYRLYRSSTGAPDSFRTIGEPAEPAFDDADFVFGRKYFYRVSAVVKGGDSVALSEDSPVLEVTPRDTFAPQPPQGLTAVFTTEFVELIWNASTEPDLAGYFVYRRSEGESETRLTAEPLSTPIYRDSTVAGGKSYTYRVTAVDAAGNESEFSASATAEAR